MSVFSVSIDLILAENSIFIIHLRISTAFFRFFKALFDIIDKLKCFAIRREKI